MGERSVEVGRMLDEERFFAPLRERFYTRVGSYWKGILKLKTTRHNPL